MNISTIACCAAGENGDNIDKNDDDESQGFKSWCIQNGYNLKDRTYEILDEEGVETLDDFKGLTNGDLKDLLSATTSDGKKMPAGDRSRLRKA